MLMRAKGWPHKLTQSADRIRLSTLLLFSAALHLLLVVALNVIGRLRLLPNSFDEYGIGISFAVDSTEYRKYIIALVNILKRDGLLAWIKDSTPFHVKLYSVCYWALGDWLGYNTISAEPLNLTYYLLILALVFLVGREAFDRRTGLIAASIVALWPSLLLHTTQLLRDPLFIAAVLALLLASTVLLRRDCSWKEAVAMASAGGLAANIIWLIRSQMWEVMIATTTLNLCLFVAAHIKRRPVRFRNLAGCALLLLIVLALPQLGRRLNLYSYPANRADVKESDAGVKEVVASRQLPPGSSLPERTSYLRRSFITSYPGAGSNIDRDVEFKSFFEILLYLPRAAEIGFLSPFPQMWFEAGPQVGLAGRLLSGFETLLMYVMEAFSLLCLWRGRRRAAAWLLFLSASVGMLALGLVVANIATLYRMRYAFWILLIILGVQGALLLLRSETPSPGAFEE